MRKLFQAALIKGKSTIKFIAIIPTITVMITTITSITTITLRTSEGTGRWLSFEAAPSRSRFCSVASETAYRREHCFEKEGFRVARGQESNFNDFTGRGECTTPARL